MSLESFTTRHLLLSSGTAAAITYTILSQLSFSSWIKLIIGGTIFLFTFLNQDFRGEKGESATSKETGILPAFPIFLIPRARARLNSTAFLLPSLTSLSTFF